MASAIFSRFDGAARAALETGETVVVLTFAGRGDDLAITLDDSRSLVASLLSALAASGDTTAQAIGDEYLSQVGGEDGATLSWHDLPPLL